MLFEPFSGKIRKISGLSAHESLMSKGTLFERIFNFYVTLRWVFEMLRDSHSFYGSLYFSRSRILSSSVPAIISVHAESIGFSNGEDFSLFLSKSPGGLRTVSALTDSNPLKNERV